MDALFDDGSHIVYVNGSYRGEDAIGRLMHDFGCKESDNMYYPELAKGVKHFKEEEGGRIEELNCTLDQIIPIRTAMGK